METRTTFLRTFTHVGFTGETEDCGLVDDNGQTLCVHVSGHYRVDKQYIDHHDALLEAEIAYRATTQGVEVRKQLRKNLAMFKEQCRVGAINVSLAEKVEKLRAFNAAIAATYGSVKA